ncbi:hypothetical protein V2W45_1235883 [Cenococcum geophilum]
MSASTAAKASASTAAKASAPAVAPTSTQVSARASDEAIDITPITSSQLLEGLEDQTRTFTSISGLRSAINTLSNHLYQGTAISQYLVFQSVTEDDFAKIDEKRYTIRRGLFTYCTDIDTLIIKVPTKEHERVTRAFTHDFARRIEHMGLTDLDDLCDMGATTYKGRSTKKEADSCWRPIAARPNPMDWPTLVFEVGVSETLRKLRNDAQWWLANSQGRVRIVLLFKINRVARTIHIEKWECRLVTPTYTLRSNRPPVQVPTQIQTVDIDANGVVTGSPPATTPPLVLHFQNILLRQPVPPEQDVIYTAQDLQRLGNGIWAVL